MKNIQTVLPENISSYLLENIWASDIFRSYHKTPGSIIDKLVQKVSQAPVFFYELSYSKERIQLTSFVRCIAFRQYDNPYIQDLYYFHELVHLASYISPENITFEEWKQNLNENELVASLHSEAFIYLWSPELLDKTFPDLWVKRFLTNTKMRPVALENDGASLDIFDLYSNWSPLYQEITHARRNLRVAGTDPKELESYDGAQRDILRYNRLRENWLPRWEPYYEFINPALNALVRQEISPAQYLNLLQATEIASHPSLVFPLVLHSLP